MSGGVDLNGVSADFGSFRAVDKATVAIKPGEFFSFLGPSGCGKTTILRMISGFMMPSEGTIHIGGEDVRDIRPNKRPTVLIFQNLALFPLMPVWENIAFGLEVRGVDKPVRRARAEELLRLVDLPGAADKAISQLSGGQKQRVAIARALAVEPKVMLLDEPLSALDLKLRQHMRAELRAIQKRTNVTFIYITHDQGEALAMSDRVARDVPWPAPAGGHAAGDLQPPRQRLRRLLRRREQYLRGPGRIRRWLRGGLPQRQRRLSRLAGAGRQQRHPGQALCAARADEARRCRAAGPQQHSRHGGRCRLRGQFHQYPGPERPGPAAGGRSAQRRCRQGAAAGQCDEPRLRPAHADRAGGRKGRRSAGASA